MNILCLGGAGERHIPSDIQHDLRSGLHKPITLYSSKFDCLLSTECSIDILNTIQCKPVNLYGFPVSLTDFC